MGFASVTGGQTTMFANNVDFTGSPNPSPQVNANGQLLIGSAIAPYIQVNTLTAGPGVTITNGPGSITIGLSGASGAVEHLTGNSGGLLNPDANHNFNTFGTGSITIAGSGSTLTTQLTGLTANAVLYGLGTPTIGLVLSGTTGQVLQTNTAAAPTWSTATYPSTTTINQILYSSAANVVSGLATANNGVLTTGTTGIPVITALASNGQVIIGSGAGAPAAATLTAGQGISITNAANSITIATTGQPTLTFTTVAFVASPYTVLAADEFLEVQSSGGAITIKLPNAPTTGRVIYVKDVSGNASADNISVTTVGGSVTIDGQTTYKLASNYAEISVAFDGTSYWIF